MTSTESHTPTREDFVRWGTAPEDRQCRYQFANGYHCRRWSVRGHDFCHKHSVWMATRVDGPIEIPLLEDPTAVQFVATQTVRALSWGQIPPANGRAILHGCRVIQSGFAQQLAEARFRLKCHRLGVDANQFLPARAPAEPAPSETNPEPQENRVPHLSPVLGEVGERASAPAADGTEAGAPLKPDVGLSGLNTPSADNPAKAGSDEPHPTTLDLQACAAPGCPTLLRLQSADRVGSLTVSPLTAFSTGRFLADRFSANPKRLPCQHIRRDRGDLFRRRKSGCRTLACPQSADRVGSLTASQLTAFQLAGS